MNCERLDDYLAGELVADEQEAFRLHLADCAGCREEVRFQETVDGLLRQATACEAPHGLRRRLVRKMQASTRRLQFAAIGAAAIAASLMLIFAERPNRRPRDVVQIGPLNSPKSDSKRQAVASMILDPSCDLLAVPQVSRQPNVTIFWLYPTIKTTAPAGATPARDTTQRSQS
jgi:hypothetical protein